MPMIGSQRAGGGGLSGLLNLVRDPEKLEKQVARYEQAKAEAVEAQSKAAEANKALGAERAAFERIRSEAELEIGRQRASLEEQRSAFEAQGKLDREDLAAQQAKLAKRATDLDAKALEVKRREELVGQQARRADEAVRTARETMAAAEELGKKLAAKSAEIAAEKDRLATVQAALRAYFGA